MGFVGFGVTVAGILIALIGAIGLAAPGRIAERQRQRDAGMTNYDDLDDDGETFIIRLTGFVFVLGGLWLVAGTPAL